MATENFIFASGFSTLDTLGVYSFTGSPDSNFPFSNLINFNFPLRPIRSTSAVTQVIRCNLTTATTIVGLYVRHTNAATIELRFSASSSSFGTPHGTIAPRRDRRTNRYNGFIDTLGITSNAYLQLTLSGTPLDGLSYYYLSNIYVASEIVELNHDMPPQYDYRVSFPRMRTKRDDQSESIIDFKKPKTYVNFPLKAATDASTLLGWTQSGEQQILDILNKNSDRGVIFYENRTRDQSEHLGRFYHMRTPDDVNITYPGTDYVIETSIELEEVT